MSETQDSDDVYAQIEEEQDAAMRAETMEQTGICPTCGQVIGGNLYVPGAGNVW